MVFSHYCGLCQHIPQSSSSTIGCTTCHHSVHQSPQSPFTSRNSTLNCLAKRFNCPEVSGLWIDYRAKHPNDKKWRHRKNHTRCLSWVPNIASMSNTSYILFLHSECGVLSSLLLEKKSFEETAPPRRLRSRSGLDRLVGHRRLRKAGLSGQVGPKMFSNAIW